MSLPHDPGSVHPPLASGIARPNRGPRRRAFTLIEAVVAIALLALAGSALLLATDTAQSAAADALEQSLANGIAQQLLDEISGLPYKEANADPYQDPLGPEAGENWMTGRSVFDDIDDYRLIVQFPPRDRWNQVLGQDDGAGNQRHPAFRLPATYFNDWAVVVSSAYADEANPANNLTRGTSNLRAITITVFKSQGGVWKVVKTVRKVVGYVPAS